MKKCISLLLTSALIFSVFSIMCITTSAIIPTEPLITINKYWSMVPVTVEDNSNFTNALRYTRTDNTTMAVAAEEGKNGGDMNVYSTGNLADKVFTYGLDGTLKEWITTGGNYRFWIKTPNYSGETIKFRLNFCADINTNDTNNTSDYYYKRSDSVNSDIEVTADGKWHEVIADFGSCTDLQKANLYALALPIAKDGCSLTGDEPQAEKTNFTIRFYNRSTAREITKSDLQFSHIEFHFSVPSALGDGNQLILIDALSTINKDWTMKQVTVSDNCNFTDALIYNQNGNTTMAAAEAEEKLGGNMNVYSSGADKLFTYDSEGTLKEWINRGGNYHFWIKTPDYAGETIKLRLNFSANINTNNANNTEYYYYYKYPSVNSDIEVVADGKWHEVIADFSNNSDAAKADLYALVSPTAKQGYTLTGDEPKVEKTAFYVRFYNKSTTHIITKADLQFSRFEFHFSTPTALGNGNIDEYNGPMPPAWNSLPQMSADEENTIFARTGLDFWTSDWNRPTHSIEADNMGLNSKDPKYGWFKDYRQIEVTNEEGYYTDDNRSDLGFYLTEKTDISDYLKTGTLRFWTNVPKDMTIRVTLLSIAPMETDPSRDSYTRTYVDIPLNKTSENDGYQEVCIPLKDFYNLIAIKNLWNSSAVAYVRIGGISNCTPDTFLKEGEIFCISHFEFWKAEAETPELNDTSRKIYSKNGNFFIKDFDDILPETSVVSAFENVSESYKYSKLVKRYFDDADFLSSYTVEVISETSEECYKLTPSGKVEVYFPLSDYTDNTNLNISVMNSTGIYNCEYITNDENLIIETDQFGEFLFMTDGQRNSTEFDSAVLANENNYYHKIAVLNTICDGAKQEYKLNNDKAILNRTMVDCNDLPFFNKANTYTTDGNYVANNGNVTKGLLRTDSTAMWDYISNNNAELRFWVKTATTKSFALNFVIRNNAGQDKSIVIMYKYPITVEGQNGWQEVRIPRSWFQDNPNDDFITASKQSDCRYVQFGFTVLGSETVNYKANTEYPTFTANDCIEFSNVIEVYSDKAYDKGDANCDEAVDIRDLVHTKKQSLKTDINVGNCDINNDNLIDAADLVYMRKYLLLDSWN